MCHCHTHSETKWSITFYVTSIYAISDVKNTTFSESKYMIHIILYSIYIMCAFIAYNTTMGACGVSGTFRIYNIEGKVNIY